MKRLLLVAVVGVLGCNKPTEENCRKALVNMQHLPLRLAPRVLLRKNPRETKHSLVNNKLTVLNCISRWHWREPP